MGIDRRRTHRGCAALRRLACATPREDEWQRTYRALQVGVREALAVIAGVERSPPA